MNAVYKKILWMQNMTRVSTSDDHFLYACNTAMTTSARNRKLVMRAMAAKPLTSSSMSYLLEQWAAMLPTIKYIPHPIQFSRKHKTLVSRDDPDTPIEMSIERTIINGYPTTTVVHKVPRTKAISRLVVSHMAARVMLTR